jgi:hypothetical protein
MDMNKTALRYNRLPPVGKKIFPVPVTGSFKV